MVVVDVKLLQTGQVSQTEVLQLLNVVLLQVQSHQPAQRRETHRTHLDREGKHFFMVYIKLNNRGPFSVTSAVLQISSDSVLSDFDVLEKVR